MDNPICAHVISGNLDITDVFCGSQKLFRMLKPLFHFPKKHKKKNCGNGTKGHDK
jgi:hypothetical protein